MQHPFFLNAVATNGKLSPVLGTIQKGTDIEDVTILVLTAFDGGTTMEVGYDSDHDAFGVAQAVSATGRKKPTLGSGVGLQTSTNLIRAYVSGAPAAGEAIVIVDGKVLRPNV